MRNSKAFPVGSDAKPPTVSATPENGEMSLSFADILARADRVLGGRAVVLQRIPVSPQRLRDFKQGGTPLRPERLVKLALLTGLDVCDVLRAGDRMTLANLLDQAYALRFADATPNQRLLLQGFALLPDATQDALFQLVTTLADEHRREEAS
jgi:hypothetical protein